MFNCMFQSAVRSQKSKVKSQAAQTQLTLDYLSRFTIHDSFFHLKHACGLARSSLGRA